VELPGWFGMGEYYALLVTVWFALIIYLLVAIVKTSKELKIKNKLSKVVSWWKERKKKKEEKPYV